ncbi:hypothetical protein Desmer_1267 [Desulfosporosinus meridiei DSM 13257]|uniref:Holin-like Toxin (Hol-Tox) n=2 Tax=Desulfosporosinus TaxID=79206 RepID=A0A1G8BG18_9FIRM|nr:hypothetical protein Desmer_1267 [Desulfosporosinus meridiei DSM 13257]SDH32139.1 hypothetical protein SAMN05443529_11227 [Desulfosporosinus hippei DSM 8344]
MKTYEIFMIVIGSCSLLISLLILVVEVIKTVFK